MIVYLTRHGQSQGNAAGFFQSKNTPLSPLGETQAAKLAERLRNISMNEIWTSHMSRAKQTAEIVNQYQRVPLLEFSVLEELKRPSIFEGKSWNDPEVELLKKNLGMGTSVAPKSPHKKYDDGESVTEFLIRMQQAFSNLEAKARSEAEDFIVCVTSHGYVTSALFLIATLGKLVTPDALHYALSILKHENTGLTVLKITKKGEINVLTFNDSSHL